MSNDLNSAPLARTLTANEQALAISWLSIFFQPDRVAKYEIAGVQAENTDSLKKSYVVPLIRLLAAYFKTGEGRYRSVYRDELLRYAPHRAGIEVRVAFFQEIVPLLEESVLNHLLTGTTRNTAASNLANVHAPLLAAPVGKPLTLLTFGDCLMTELRVFLPEQSGEAGVPLDMRAYYFSSRMGRGISTENVIEAIEKNKADMAAFSFFSYEGLPMYPALLRDAETMKPQEIEERIVQIMAQVRQFVVTVRESTEIPFLIHNVSGLPLTRYRKRLPFLSPISASRGNVVARLNEAIAEMIANTENCILIDEHAVADRYGLRISSKSVVPDRIGRDAFFHTQRFGEFLVDEYVEKMRAYHILKKIKVLLIDFDHTLWRGVMADGAVEHHLDRQKLLKKLQQAGIVLVAVSKNQAESIRWNEIHLQPEDFALLHINWDLKAQSIERTAQLLDLGLDSFAFIDDNPAERHLVQQQLPKVRTMDALDPNTWRALEWMLAFPNTRQTDESRMRTALYREQAQRRESMAKPMDYAAMMQGLGLRVRFGLATAADLDRLSELIQRTNQFNTTTIRYTRAQLQEFLSSDIYRIYVADLEDRFGKLGLVLATIVERGNGACIFDSFVMSCRAMGFELERLALCLTMETEAADTFIGRFVPTDRNTPAAEFYGSNGFTQASDHEWVLNGDGTRPEKPAWFEVKSR